MALPVILPRQGQSVESCILTEILVKKGNQVTRGDLLLRYETDKAVFELESPGTGQVLELLYKEGDEVPVLSTVIILGDPDEPVTTDDRPQQSSVSPRARKLAGRLGVPLVGVTGSGPGGRIIEKDVERWAAEKGRLTRLAADLSASSGTAVPSKGGGPGERIRSGDLLKKDQVPREEEPQSRDDSTVIPLSNIRKIIARKMQDSLQNSAQLTHHTSADARKMLTLRSIIKQKMETRDFPNITLNDMVCFAVVKALQKMPVMNSHFLGDAVRTFTKVHLGMAVDTERGLMVPVLKNADDLNIKELSAQLRQLADDCKSGNIDPDLLSPEAAGFTVTNLGAYGVEMFTPVLNLPQCGILGVNAIIQRPGDTGNGIIGFIPYIGLSLTYDHRAVDGAPASAFLREVKEQIENLEINL